MLIEVDRHSGVPVYRQIMDQIKFHVAGGLLRPGAELPSTRTLSAALGLNPMTVSKSYSLLEMEEVNPQFKQADVVLVVGANDVVNPAAETTPGAPIYGMPILHANQARQVVFMKRSMRPCFAGIENELLYEPSTTLLFGDAKDTMGKLLAEVKSLRV